MIAPALKKPHHHGDLRNALVQAGIALLAESGSQGLTLRKCAARAGVSHAAPAHHFDGLAGLKMAIAHEGLTWFRMAMLDAVAQGSASPRGRLKSVCRGYLAFATQNRALFDLIFGFDPTGQVAKTLQDESSAAYQVLRDVCAPFVPPGTDPVAIETQVWSLIHGFTTLSLSGRFQNPDLFDQVVALLHRVGTDPAQ